jgi:hypothetical protein
MVSMIMLLITHDGVCDDADDVDDVNDDVIDDVIEGECELRWHWQKLEYAVSKMNIWMKPAAQIESRTESQTIA